MPIGQSKAMWCNLVHLQVSPDLEPMQVAPPDDQILNKYNDQENWIFRKWLKILQPLPEPNAHSFLPDDGLSSHPAFLLGPTCCPCLGSSQDIALRMRPNLICRLWIWQCRGRLQQRLPYPARLDHAKSCIGICRSVSIQSFWLRCFTWDDEDDTTL